MFSKVFLFFCLLRMINSKFFPKNAKRQEEKESFYNGVRKFWRTFSRVRLCEFSSKLPFILFVSTKLSRTWCGGENLEYLTCLYKLMRFFLFRVVVCLVGFFPWLSNPPKYVQKYMCDSS